ncbi:molybdate-binding protein [Citricoccus zhacaiensis]|uniref:Molybdate-binding protein n=1 Tax=Citricoccus zhacaiensis TaxID=489142 RepID=A0ABQ2M2I7_9MICC|nr:molybdate ABC transporter substrate-binding protein [Citricoccus zhacaiensis]GGO45992.1 molybdate-binding protein [Citricoccus zhacaiensis]
MRGRTGHHLGVALGLIVGSGVVLAGCSAPSSGSAESGTTLTVFAAASLGDSFEELADGFEQENPGVEVEYNIAGSSSLAEQILAGAPADVFASADEPNMHTVVAAGENSGEPEPFATNVLTLVTPADIPADTPANTPGITSLEDATAEGVKLVVCAPQVPCGRAALALAEDAGVELSPVSEEASVTDVLGKVTSGEADAGLVYVTDALGAGESVNAIELENADSAVNTYPITVLAAAAENGSEHPELAQRFVDYVLSEEGQSVLEADGFGAP